jgi:hypothetical protein
MSCASKAIHLYEAGVPLPYIRDILGHVDLSTPEIYARASTEAQRKALEAAYLDIVTSDLPEWNKTPASWTGSLPDRHLGPRPEPACAGPQRDRRAGRRPCGRYLRDRRPGGRLLGP